MDETRYLRVDRPKEYVPTPTVTKTVCTLGATLSECVSYVVKTFRDI